MRQMVDAHDQWDSNRVLAVGAQAEADLLIIDFDLKKRVEIEMFEMMARAFSRSAQYSKSVEYFERLLKHYDPIEKYSAHTRTQIRIADLHIVMKHLDKAKVLYKQVYAVGERDGNFEFHSKACLGLSKIAKEAGNKTEALALAKQALVAAGLLLDGEYSKSRDQAQAIIAIIDYTDITSEEFDEGLLTRLDELATAVDATEEGGSSLCVKAVELEWRRHLSMGRWVECANACAKVMRLADQTRFKQIPDVQAIYVQANETVKYLYDLGLVEMNAMQ